jgi:hypothetical protein
MLAGSIPRNSLLSHINPKRIRFPGRANHHLREAARRSFASAPPTLSWRSRVDLFLVVAGALGSWVYIQSSDWDRDVWEAKQRLLKDASETSSSWDQQHTPMEEQSDLPLPLQTYLNVALNGPDPKHRNLVSAKQSGEFFASQRWYPFTSNLLVLAHSDERETPPGFVWEAAVEILQMPNRVLESYIEGKGNIITKAWGKIPMIQMEEEEPFILFWLAMTPLCPVTFRQTNISKRKRPVIVWNSIHDLSSCSGELLDESNGNTFYIELGFDQDTKLLKSIRVTSTCLPKPWQVNYNDYHRMSDDFLFPTRIEVGTWSGQEFHGHLKIVNHEVQPYHPRKSSVPNKQQ